MRLFRTAAVIAALVLPLGGCLTLDEIGTAFKFASASVKNPVSLANVYEIRNGYAAALTVSKSWRTLCFGMTYKAIMASPVVKPVCSRRRAVQRAINNYGPKAGQATEAAEAFVRDHPTLDASIVISSAMQAVAKFRSVIPAQQ